MGVTRPSDATGYPCPDQFPVVCGNLSDPNYKYCYPDGYICPVNDLTIATAAPSADYSNLGSLDGGYALYGTTKANKDMYVHSLLNYGDACVDVFETHRP